MAIESDIRDQAYECFIQEAPELLQLIEENLLTLRQERNTAKIHNMMRAAHSIKGGAASVGLEAIKTLAHSLEDIFQGLHNEELKIDAEVENLLLQAYDCLRLPLIEQLNNGQFDSEQAIANAEPVFAQIEAQIGDFLKGYAGNIPSSVELGVDIALSIFEVDVAQGLERLESVLASPQSNEVAGELRAQAEVFAGLAELLNLPGFGAIASSAIAALEAHPKQALEITQIALTDFQVGKQAVINGDRTQGGTPSNALTNLATAANANTAENNLLAVWETINHPLNEEITSTANKIDGILLEPDLDASALDDIFGGFALGNPDTATLIDQVSETIAQENIPVVIVPLSPVIATNELEEITASASLDDVFGDFTLASEVNLNSEQIPVISTPSQELFLEPVKAVNAEELIASVEQIFDSLPLIETSPVINELAASSELNNLLSKVEPGAIATTTQKLENTPTGNAANLSVRVDVERLERMNNVVGELAINRNSLSLQNAQLQATVQELLRRFDKFKNMSSQLRAFSDQMLVEREHSPITATNNPKHLRFSKDTNSSTLERNLFSQAGDFDSLEMDSYGELHSLLQNSLEEIVQLEETVGDVVLFAGQSSESLEGQRQMLGHLRDDLMWARMLPLGEVVNRLPRMLRDLSRSYNKPVGLKLNGTGVLVDKAALEKLYDPLLHLVRNAFDHGIEMPEIRHQRGKSLEGTIEIRAYHQGNQTVVEVRDDGGGLNLERIRSRAIEMKLATPEQLTAANSSQLLELIFEPGFSTATQVSELSGRGVGLDVVRSQLRLLKGNVTVASEPGKGTVFTLRIPLTLTISKLLVGLVGSTAFALPSDSIKEILIPQPEQIKNANGQRFLHWQDRIIPAYNLSELLNYNRPLPETSISSALEVFPTPEDWAAPMLLLEQNDQILAVEIDRLVTEQELVIKPFGSAIASPSYMYGCTILGDGSLIPVIDSAALVNSFIGQTTKLPITTNQAIAVASTPIAVKRDTTKTILVVDDSITLRQTIVLTLEKAGYRVLQARDGKEAIEQLQKTSTIQLVVCDVEMPNMNGFEFLSYRRQDPQISTIPTVMLTSRSSAKHRQLAMHLGANNYFTKPYVEQEFVAAIAKIITQDTYLKPALVH